jgi:2,3,4,5-tetrahydropyridine-2,6-dicarboxylate N-succinyltransferase
MTAASLSQQQFLENIRRCTQPAASLALLKVFLDGELVRTIANVPGQSGALRVLSSYQVNNELSPSAAAKALEVFAPFVDEARAQPGVHPTIDLLLGLGPGQALRLERVESTPDLFVKLLEGSASQCEKQAAVDLLDRGVVRCAEKIHDYTLGPEGVRLTKSAAWVTQPYAVACMNAAFSAFPMIKMGEHFFDKVPLKTEGWQQADFERAGVRFVPGSFARRGAFIGAGTTIMPGGIVNIGAYIAGQGVMIDGGARVATGAQVGKGVKLGAGSGIEGILEPQGRLPAIVEDNVRVGANCELCGIVEEQAVVASGVVMASGKKVYDLRTNAEVEPRYMAVGDKVFDVPYIPRNRVAVSGVYSKTDRLGIDCIVLLEKDAADTSLAQLPRNAALYVKL